MNAEQIVFVMKSIGVKKIRKHSRNIEVSCPFAGYSERGHASGRDTRPSMRILVEPGGVSPVYCHGCHYRGTVRGVVEKMRWLVPDVDFSALMDYAREHDRMDPERWIDYVQAGYTPDQMLLRTKDEGVVDAGTTFEVLSDDEFAPYRTNVFPRYLKMRGFADEMIGRVEIGWHPGERRILFPVRRRDGLLVGIIGRIVDDRLAARGVEKYTNFHHFQKGLYLYGEDAITGSDIDPLIVVEGPIDRLWLTANGILNVTATMGSTVSPVQAKRIEQVAGDRAVILFYDGDRSGEEGVRDATKLLGRRLGPKLLVAQTPTGKDPAGMKAKLCRRLLRDAVPHASWVGAGA